MNNTVKNSNGELINIRIFFSKTDRAKYISHLDLNRTMQRTVKRSKLPVWETEGFNPHIYLTFALPLSLGIESMCEVLDIKFIESVDYNEIKEKLNFSLPNDIRVISAAKPVFKHTEIKKAEYDIFSDIKQYEFHDFIKQEKIMTIKKTKKKGISEIDLKQFIEYVPEDDRITLILPAGTELNINPLLVLNAFGTFSGKNFDFPKIIRTGMYTENGEKFI